MVDELGYEGYQLTVRDVTTPVDYTGDTPRESLGAIESIKAVDSVRRALDVLSAHPYAFEFLQKDTLKEPLSELLFYA